jgi:hypothetical protein
VDVSSPRFEGGILFQSGTGRHGSVYGGRDGIVHRVSYME